jgi:hypothetical protein
MKYLKLIWLIMSGRLRIAHRNRPEQRNRPEKNEQLTPIGLCRTSYTGNPLTRV